MLDANARYIPKGVKFFVSGCVDSDSALTKIGVNSGEYYLCKMIDDSNRNPRFSIKVNGKVHIIKHSYDYSFLVYQCMPEGKGFIDDIDKAKCEDLIGGFNDTYWGRK